MKCAEFFLFGALLLLHLSIGQTCDTPKNSAKFRSIKLSDASAEIELRQNDIVLKITNSEATLRSVLFSKDSVTQENWEFKFDDGCEQNATCILANGIIHAKIKGGSQSNVLKISRTVDNPDGQITDCFKLDDGTQWFGGPQMRYQHWPIQNMYFEEEPYVPTHPTNMAVTERYWLSSKGFYVFIDEKAPLFLDQNNYLDKHICFIAKSKSPYRTRNAVTMDYEIGIFEDPRAAHENVIRNHFDLPTGHPNERMVRHPIWSTWARYKGNVNDAVVRQFAREIVDHGFNNSQLEIDDNWETCYGSANFDASRFPNVPELTDYLKGLGFRVTLWIHPFINADCNDNRGHAYARTQGYFVKNQAGNIYSSWWRGDNSSLIDFTNPRAVAYWVERLGRIQDLGIDSFKFDAGEGSWAPQVSQLNGPTDLQPGLFTLNYTSNLASHFDDNIEVRVGWRSQNLPIFVRMIDKDTKWTWNNGLPTLITTLLQMNLNGYVYVLPDMIGGNGYVTDDFDAVELPPKEMFIRWLQANVFMPSLQYSFVPWDFDDPEIIKISKHFTDLHANYTSTIMNLMKNAMKTGAPINPPIWWVDPLNAEAHAINDEYLLGEEILVAPVVKEDAVIRDVYLPAGKWKDANNDRVYAGPIWLKDYPAPLDTLPHFFKQ